MSDPGLIFDEGDLSGFVDGRLEPARAAALAESLATDRDARARVDSWKRQNETLRTMFASVLFEPVPLRLLPTALPGQVAAAALGAGPKAVRAGPAPVVPERASGAVAMTMIGVALIAFVAGALTSVGTDGFGLTSRVESATRVEPAASLSPGRSFAGRAAETHQTFLTDVSRSVEITAADEPRLLRWMQRSLATPLRIPDLQQLGWSLIGGRIVPGENGPAGFLVYGSGADRLGLYIARTSAPALDDIRTVDGGPGEANVAYWVKRPFGYAMTTTHPAEWLDRNAESFHASIAAQLRDSASAQ